MKHARVKILCLTPLLLAAAAARGQSDPSQSQPGPVSIPLYTSFRVPTVNGTFTYSASASELLTFGYNGSNATTSALSISGNVGYLSSSVTHPFSIVYSGGYLENTVGTQSHFFQSVNASQLVTLSRWTLSFADILSYTPDTPAIGLSGIPGLGDVGIASGLPPNNSILALDTPEFNNSIGVTAHRKLTGRTDLQASANYTTLRYVDDSQALKPNTLSASVGLGHSFDSRTSIYGDFSFQQYTYSGTPYTSSVEGASFGFKRQITRKLSLSAAGGPQRIDASSFTGTGPSYNYSANANLNYTLATVHPSSLGLSYSHGTNAGSGIALGAINDTAAFTGTRSLTRDMQLSAQVSYNRTSSLQTVYYPQLITDAVIGSAQVNRPLTKTLSIYASYSAQRQVVSGTYQGIAPINGLVQTIGFGVTYSPKPIHLGRK